MPGNLDDWFELQNVINIDFRAERAAGVFAQRLMPRYFFHLRDDLDCPDHEGSQFVSLSAAKASAAEYARWVMADLIRREGRIALHHRIDIENSEGDVLSSLPFRNVVKIEETDQSEKEGKPTMDQSDQAVDRGAYVESR